VPKILQRYSGSFPVVMLTINPIDWMSFMLKPEAAQSQLVLTTSKNP